MTALVERLAREARRVSRSEFIVGQVIDDRPITTRPRPSVAPHTHEWQPVGIVYLQDGSHQIAAVAQSCHCGAVQAIPVPGALR